MATRRDERVTHLDDLLDASARYADSFQDAALAPGSASPGPTDTSAQPRSLIGGEPS